MISTDFLCVGLWGYVESAGDSQVFSLQLNSEHRLVAEVVRRL